MYRLTRIWSTWQNVNYENMKSTKFDLLLVYKKDVIVWWHLFYTYSPVGEISVVVSLSEALSVSLLSSETVSDELSEESSEESDLESVCLSIIFSISPDVRLFTVLTGSAFLKNLAYTDHAINAHMITVTAIKNRFM